MSARPRGVNLSGAGGDPAVRDRRRKERHGNDGGFLPVARRSPTNYVLVVGLVVAPVGTLIGLRDDPGGAPFVLTAVGPALTVVGPLLTSPFLSEPTYDVILGWDPDAVPADWLAVRRRYLTLNWVRAVFTWVAFALFLAATYAYAGG